MTRVPGAALPSANLRTSGQPLKADNAEDSQQTRWASCSNTALALETAACDCGADGLCLAALRWRGIDQMNIVFQAASAHSTGGGRSCYPHEIRVSRRVSRQLEVVHQPA